MTQYRLEKSPLEKWLEANRECENLGNSLLLLLGHAWGGILRRSDSVFAVFSPEKALSFIQRLPKSALPEGLGNWIAQPKAYAEEIVRFFFFSRDFSFPAELGLHRFASAPVDLRGVACPMGSVRARLVLSGVNSGEEILFLVDDGEPIENVPRTLVETGNRIVFRRKKEKYWELCVWKG